MRAFDLPDHKVFIQNRAVDVEDAVVFTNQIQAQPALPDGGNGRNVLHLEHVFYFVAFAGCKSDVRTRKQRTQTGYAALVDTRLDHPKLCIAADEAGYVRIELGGYFHAFLVVAQFDSGNASDIDAQYLNDRIVDLNAFRAVHQERNHRPPVADFLNPQPATGNQRNQRDQPDGREEGVVFADACLSVSVWRRAVVSHIFPFH